MVDAWGLIKESGDFKGSIAGASITVFIVICLQSTGVKFYASSNRCHSGAI